MAQPLGRCPAQGVDRVKIVDAGGSSTAVPSLAAARLDATPREDNQDECSGQRSRCHPFRADTPSIWPLALSAFLRPAC
jgi:hypothetical protein